MESSDQRLQNYVQKNMHKILLKAQEQDLTFGVRADEVIILRCMGEISIMDNVVGTCHLRDELAIKAVNVFDNESHETSLNLSLITTIP
jgi:hypothetical protein